MRREIPLCANLSRPGNPLISSRAGRRGKDVRKKKPGGLPTQAVARDDEELRLSVRTKATGVTFRKGQWARVRRSSLAAAGVL